MRAQRSLSDTASELHACRVDRESAVGAVSAPVRQTDGVFVIRVDAKKPADRAAFEAQKTELRARRLQVLRQQRVQSFLDDLRKNANIKDKRKEINAQLGGFSGYAIMY